MNPRGLRDQLVVVPGFDATLAVDIMGLSIDDFAGVQHFDGFTGFVLGCANLADPFEEGPEGQGVTNEGGFPGHPDRRPRSQAA